MSARLTCRHYARRRVGEVSRSLPDLCDPAGLLAMLGSDTVATLVFDVDTTRTLWLVAVYPGRVDGKTLYEEDGAEVWFSESHGAWIPERRQWLDIEALEGE